MKVGDDGDKKNQTVFWNVSMQSWYQLACVWFDVL